MGNSSTIFDRPFQINHIQRSTVFQLQPCSSTTTLSSRWNWINFLFFSPSFFFNRSVGIWSRRPRRPNRSVCSCCGLRVWKNRWKHDILSKKKKKRKEIWKLSMELIVLFPAIAYFSCLSFVVFFYYYSLFCLSLWHFPIALTYEGTVPVWRSGRAKRNLLIRVDG